MFTIEEANDLLEDFKFLCLQHLSIFCIIFGAKPKNQGGRIPVGASFIGIPFRTVLFDPQLLHPIPPSAFILNLGSGESMFVDFVDADRWGFVDGGGHNPLCLGDERCPYHKGGFPRRGACMHAHKRWRRS